MDHAQFENNVCASLMYTSPGANTADFVNQLEGVNIQELEHLEPLKPATRSSSKGLVSTFIAPDAIHANRERRNLKRRWKKQESMQIA